MHRRLPWTIDDALAALAGLALGAAAVAGWAIAFDRLLEAAYGAGFGGHR